MTAAKRLGRKVGLVLPTFGAPLELLLQDSRARELFPRCLLVAYHLSRSMVPLMEVALARARELAPEDPVAAGLAEYLERHIPEETHADQPGDAVVDDLAALGLDPIEVREAPVTPQIGALVAAQLAWINDDHPVAILGFLELEAHQADRPTIERLIERTGLPRAAFNQLLLHARLDLVHARDLHRVLDSLPLKWRHEHLLGASALLSMAFVTDAMLDALDERTEMVEPIHH